MKNLPCRAPGQASPQCVTGNAGKTVPIVWSLWLLVLAFAPIDARAELFGLPSGRLADVSRHSSMSVEVGFAQGEFLERDYSQPSIRINYRAEEDLMLFGDVGQSDVDGAENTTFGIGALYDIQNLFGFTQSVALKGSIHQFGYRSTRFTTSCSGPMPIIDPLDGSIFVDGGFCTESISSIENKGKSIALDLLISGNPITALKVEGYASPTWYANLGLHTFSGVNIDSIISVGGGLVLPLSNVEAYVGLDIIEEFILGFGVRYALR